jgi:hypothetical protein
LANDKADMFPDYGKSLGRKETEVLAIQDIGSESFNLSQCNIEQPGEISQPTSEQWDTE